MPWTPPSDPVTGTVITVAYAVANLLTQLRWLRGMTGNADPPGTSYCVVSNSTTSTSWSKVPADAFAANAVTTHLGYTPANRAGDVLSGDLTVTRSGSGSSTTGVLYLGSNSGTKFLQWDGSQFNLTGGPLVVGGNATVPGDLMAYRPGAPTTGVIYLNSSTTTGYLFYDGTNYQLGGSGQLFRGGQRVWDSGNDGTGSGLNADTVRGFIPQTAAAAGRIPVADGAGKIDAWVTAGGTPGPHNHAGDALLPLSLNGFSVSASPFANRIPVSDASGKLDSWVTPASFSIPSGTGIWVRNAGEIPAGFARETTLDGLLLVGAGTSFDFPAASNAPVAGTAYGNTWLHQHGIGALAVPVSVSVNGSATGGAADNTGQPSATGGTVSGTPPPSFGTGTHTHSLNGVSLAVSASGGGSGSTTATNTGNTTWIPPMRAVVWARKT